MVNQAIDKFSNEIIFGSVVERFISKSDDGEYLFWVKVLSNNEQFSQEDYKEVISFWEKEGCEVLDFTAFINDENLIVEFTIKKLNNKEK